MSSGLEHGYRPGEIQKILNDAQSILETDFTEVRALSSNLEVIGTAYRNPEPQDKTAARISVVRLGCQEVPLTPPDQFTLSTEELLSNICSASENVDLMLVSFMDPETFGQGRSIVEEIPGRVECPVINLRDDIYAPQAALSNLLGIQSRLGPLAGKRIAISWGFGSVFPLPTVPHSMIAAASQLGAKIRVVAPKDFGLLRRVIREAEESAPDDVSIEETDQFEGAFDDVDVIYALNWCRLSDFQHPERNTEYASEYRDWFFTTDNTPENGLFLTQAPAQTELLASQKLLSSERNMTQDWLKRRVVTLAASMAYLAPSLTNPPMRHLI
ncbi:hypothetical protein EU537_11205 [Candidatus Thorarchaeota archaeon]|nr:MAG: hypothetical protein EU537_11205 [Candidatus Thorarchaeota archaeon]